MRFTAGEAFLLPLPACTFLADMISLDMEGQGKKEKSANGLFAGTDRRINYSRSTCTQLTESRKGESCSRNSMGKPKLRRGSEVYNPGETADGYNRNRESLRRRLQGDKDKIKK